MVGDELSLFCSNHIKLKGRREMDDIRACSSAKYAHQILEWRALFICIEWCWQGIPRIINASEKLHQCHTDVIFCLLSDIRANQNCLLVLKSLNLISCCHVGRTGLLRSYSIVELYFFYLKSCDKDTKNSIKQEWGSFSQCDSHVNQIAYFSLCFLLLLYNKTSLFYIKGHNNL